MEPIKLDPIRTKQLREYFEDWNKHKQIMFMLELHDSVSLYQKKNNRKGYKVSPQEATLFDDIKNMVNSIKLKKIEDYIYQVEMVRYDNNYGIVSGDGEFYDTYDEALKEFEHRKDYAEFKPKYGSGVLLNEYVKSDDLDSHEHEYVGCLFEYNYNNFKAERDAERNND